MSAPRVSMILRGLLAVALAAALEQGACDDQATAQPGSWRGPWYLGMTSGVAVLELTDDGGTLTLTNNEKFGEEPVRITDLERLPGSLQFRALGADGKPLECRIPVTVEGSRALGFCRYGGFNLRFEFSRSRSGTGGN